MDLNSYKTDWLRNIFRKESRYGWTIALLVGIHATYMKYLFPRELANTPLALSIIDLMSCTVPAIHLLRFPPVHHSYYLAPYTNYWGMYYSSFWLISPIFIFLGFRGAFYFSPLRYKNLISEIKMWRLIVTSVIFISLGIYVYMMPLLSKNNAIINQMSDSLFKLYFSWMMVAGCLAGVGQTICVCCQKIKLNK